MASAEMQVFLGHDPAASFRAVTDPVLAIWGGLDPLTAPAPNASALIAARNAAAPLTIFVAPGDEHFFLRGEGLQPGEHRMGRMRLSPALIEAVDAWLGQLMQ